MSAFASFSSIFGIISSLQPGTSIIPLKGTFASTHCSGPSSAVYSTKMSISPETPILSSITLTCWPNRLDVHHIISFIFNFPVPRLISSLILSKSLFLIAIWVSSMLSFIYSILSSSISIANSSSQIFSASAITVIMAFTLIFLELITLTLKSSITKSTLIVSPSSIPSILITSSKGILPSSLCISTDGFIALYIITNLSLPLAKILFCETLIPSTTIFPVSVILFPMSGSRSATFTSSSNVI